MKVKRHALFVGVDDYADPTIQKLAFPTKDAAELANVFRRLLKFDRVEKLLDPGHADDIIDFVGDMTMGLGPGDLFFFFFAGHGFRVKDNHVLVCAKDAWGDLEDEDAGLRIGRLKRKLRGPWNRMIVLDACQNDIRATRGAVDGVTARDLSLIHAVEAAPASGEGAQIMVTSCSEGQKALEVSDLRHGLFTSALLESVKDFAEGHRFLDPDVLKDDLSRRMQILAVRYRLGGKQEPMFTIPGNTRIVLLEGDASAPPPPPPPPPLPVVIHDKGPSIGPSPSPSPCPAPKPVPSPQRPKREQSHPVPANGVVLPTDVIDKFIYMLRNCGLADDVKRISGCGADVLSDGKYGDRVGWRVRDVAAFLEYVKAVPKPPVVDIMANGAEHYRIGIRDWFRNHAVRNEFDAATAEILQTIFECITRPEDRRTK